MRVNLLILSCMLSISTPAAAQYLGGPARGDPRVDVLAPIGSAEVLAWLEQSALMGDRHASAVLAMLLQDTPDIEGHLVKSALHLQVAIAAGCKDLDVLAERAVARLSHEDRLTYEQALPYWLPAPAPVTSSHIKDHCLSW